MTAASDNKFPKLIITEGTAPSSPSAGDQKLYIDSTSHQLSRKNSSGTVVNLETNQTAGAASAHGARVKRASGDTSVGTNTLTAIPFDAEDFDTDTIHDTVTNNTRLTIPSISGVTTGLWAVSGSGYSNITTGTVDIAFRVGGSTVIGFERLQSNAGGISGYGLTVNYVFTAADYIECLIRTSGAGSVTFDAGSSPLFSIVYLGKVS